MLWWERGGAVPAALRGGGPGPQGGQTSSSGFSCPLARVFDGEAHIPSREVLAPLDFAPMSLLVASSQGRLPVTPHPPVTKQTPGPSGTGPQMDPDWRLRKNDSLCWVPSIVPGTQ